MVIDSRLARATTVFFPAKARDCNDQHLAENRILAQLPGELETVHSRHLKIQKNRVRPSTARRLESGDPVISQLAVMSLLLAQHAESARGIDILIDDQYA